MKKSSPIRITCRWVLARTYSSAGSRSSQGRAAILALVQVSATDWLMREAGFENEEVGVSLACYDVRVNRGVKPATFLMKLPPDTEISDGLPLMPGAIRP